MIVDDILGNKKAGTYLDIGAYDPRRLSNSKRFYDLGWRGNVEPSPARFERFPQERPEDINLNVGLSDSAGTLTYYDVVPNVFSTFSKERVKQLKAQSARINAEIEISVITMKDLFVEYLNQATVDFCTIDAEGMDLAILKGNDWSRFRPRVICVEVSLEQPYQVGGEDAESIQSLLSTVGYNKHSVTAEFGVPLNEIYVSAI
ncbi:MAG: FkbM family methyltransferase [Acidobacteriota bacterium]